MKKVFLSLILTIVAGCMYSFAQNNTATIKGKLITITDTQSSVAGLYTADISKLYESEDEASQALSMLNDNRVSIQLDWKTKTAKIQLLFDVNSKSWSCKNWNEYFIQKAN